MACVRRPATARGVGDMISAWTLSEALLWARATLTEAEVDSPHLDSELLLAYALGCQRAQLHTHPDQVLQPQQWSRYVRLIARRAAREPLAYLIGHQEFYGLDFLVDRRVLIPRPETEVLVEQAICRGNRLLQSRGHLTIADVGTGCGAIAIVLALSLPPAEMYATDVSALALEVAARNCRRYTLEGRIHLLQGDLLTPLPQPVDLVVANLPYVALKEVAALLPEISCYEPRQAWNGGVEGLHFIERLLAQAGEYVNDRGSILLEIGSTQGRAVRGLVACRFPAATVEILRDGAGRDRVISVDQVGRDTRTRGGGGPCLT